MGLFKKLLGICETQPPAQAGCWAVEGGRVRLDLSKAPELSAKGGAVRLEGIGLRKRILVIRGDDDAIHAFINKCSHAGRRFDPISGTSTVKCCSVGGSAFDYSGDRQSGLARKPIKPLAVDQDGDDVVINVS